MKGCLTLVLAITLVSRLPTIVAISQPQDQNAFGVEQGEGSIAALFDPLGLNPKYQFMAHFSNKKPLIPEPIKDNETVFGSSDGGDDFEDGIGGSEAASVHLKPILQPVSTRNPLVIFQRKNHVVRPTHLRAFERSKALPTNKFYGNLILGDSHAPVWTQPYGLRWESNGPGQQGLGISHIDDNMKGFGPVSEIPTVKEENEDAHRERSKYYINPFLVNMGISATELDERHGMTVGNFGEFGCTMLLVPRTEKKRGRLNIPRASIRIPIVRGMAFVTAVYKNLTPQFYSTVLVRTLTLDPKPLPNGWVKYRFLIENGITWLLYAKQDSTSGSPLVLTKIDQGKIAATSGKFTGLIQIAKLPVGNEAEAENIYDQAVGVYPTRGNLAIAPKYLSGEGGGYRIDWKLAGNTKQQFIHFTLPHHRNVITDVAKPTSLVLPSTTKGKMVAYRGSSWHLYEPERLSVGFLPKGWSDIVTKEHLDKIRKQAMKDSELDFANITDLNSMYFAGKGLAKFALVTLVASDVLKDADLTKKCLDKLKVAFARFMENRQQFPLVYDFTWKGLVSVQGFDLGPLADFGNSWYNDHHYHYGYFIHAASIIQYLDPVWKAKPLTSFINSLMRDVANPSKLDKHFPVFRSFDWYMGHSWSQGIFVSLDGKDEESTSEDINLYYAMSLWGKVTKKPEVERLAELMLTVARRSIQSYFLMEDDNENHPEIFVGNKVTGILFENKADHSTYFSPRLECIQGIQMIPATPALPHIRRHKFVKEEWDTLLAPHIDQVNDGWKSILMMNYGMINKDEAWKYFADDTKIVPLDDGMTLTWALFYVASHQEVAPQDS
ncbi:hypothetical protein BGX27_005135 [Mortierella sp. AM989]|nr:hypothetical protein BGX27_005135 [Mortierella sp. AM989]